MKTLYLDCSSGIAGNMFIGALLDMGMPWEGFVKDIKKLNLSDYKLIKKRVVKRDVPGTYFNVAVDEKPQPERHLKEIVVIIEQSKLSVEVKRLAKRIFLTMGKAEANAHRVPLSEVHFHEVGAVDSIIDIVGAAIGLAWLKPDKIVCSSVNVGSGKAVFSHGTVTVPVPAVKELLRGKPIYSNGTMELTTPTGAAILAAVVDECNTMPLIDVDRKGIGAGKMETPFPNVFRMQYGEMMETDYLIETNIDDMNPQLYEYVIEKLLKAGAMDVFYQPIQMKKNRPGVKLSVLCAKEKLDLMLEVVFAETTTLGVRILEVGKVMQERSFTTVKTKYGNIPMKIGRWKGKVVNAAPEYEVCKAIAQKRKVPLKEVIREAMKKVK